MRTSITVEFNLFTLLLGAVDPETSQTMPEERLVDNLLTFLLAGHHTIAVTLTWTLYLLSQPLSGKPASWRKSSRSCPPALSPVSTLTGW
jgi:Cytochrome P450